MDSPLVTLFLDCSTRRLRQNTGRIRQCLDRLDEEQVWRRGSDNANAIGNLMLHLAGNVRQWIVCAIGGAPDTRVRDAEFAAAGGWSRQELAARLEAAVEEACGVVEGLDEGRLQVRHTIQGYESTELEAIYHVVEHFAMHTGQILFATKALTGEDLGFYRHLAPGAGGHREQTP